jgi:hypothetical protein
MLQAKARAEKDSVLKVSPISGAIAPYSTAQLQVTFKPLAPQQDKGFAGQPLTPQQQAQLFDCLLQVRAQHQPQQTLAFWVAAGVCCMCVAGSICLLAQHGCYADLQLSVVCACTPTATVATIAAGNNSAPLNMPNMPLVLA